MPPDSGSANRDRAAWLADHRGGGGGDDRSAPQIGGARKAALRRRRGAARRVCSPSATAATVNPGEVAALGARLAGKSKRSYATLPAGPCCRPAPIPIRSPRSGAGWLDGKRLQTMEQALNRVDSDETRRCLGAVRASAGRACGANRQDRGCACGAAPERRPIRRFGSRGGAGYDRKVAARPASASLKSALTRSPPRRATPIGAPQRGRMKPPPSPAAETAADHAVRLAFFAAALRSAVERGEPFAAELAALKSLVARPGLARAA